MSILHPVCENKFFNYHRLSENDVSVTSCSNDFEGKEGFTRINFLHPVFKLQPVSWHEPT